VEVAAPASIWSLRGLKYLTHLVVKIRMRPGRQSRIEEGIMETYS